MTERVLRSLAASQADTTGTRAESAIVRDIIAELGALGYEPVEIGQRKAKGSGTTVGCPDFLFRRQNWPTGIWCAMEAKTARGRVRPEQQTLADRNGVCIVRSVEDALVALYRTECALGEDGAAGRLSRKLKGLV